MSSPPRRFNRDRNSDDNYGDSRKRRYDDSCENDRENGRHRRHRSRDDRRRQRDSPPRYDNRGRYRDDDYEVQRRDDRRSSSNDDDGSKGRRRNHHENGRKRSGRRNRDDGIDRQSLSWEIDREARKEEPMESKNAPPEEVVIDDVDEVNEDCAYICELPNNVTKQDLINFVQEQYQMVRKITPEIIACSIRDYEHDACVRFKDPFHARLAEEVLDKVRWIDVKIATPRWEPRYLRMFKFDEYAKEIEKDEAGEENLPQPVTYAKNSPCAYFAAKHNPNNCVYLHNLPKGLAPQKLKRFIIEKLKRFVIGRSEKGKEVKPEIIVACYLRSQMNDACVEFEAIWHTNRAIEQLDCKVVQNNDAPIRVQRWDPKMVSAFMTYYTEKEERKKKKHRREENPNDTNASEGATISTAAATAVPKLKKELASVKKELEKWKSEADRLKKDVCSVTRHKISLGAQHTRLQEEIEDLKKQRVEFKSLTNAAAKTETKLRAELGQAREQNKLKDKQITSLKLQLQEANGKISSTKEQVKDAQACAEGQQEELSKKQVNLEGVKKELNMTEQTLGHVKTGAKTLEKQLLDVIVKQDERQRQAENLQRIKKEWGGNSVEYDI